VCKNLLITNTDHLYVHQNLSSTIAGGVRYLNLFMLESKLITNLMILRANN